MIIGLGCAQIILGMPWLSQKYPQIDWVKKSIAFDKEHIRKTTLSTELAITVQKDETLLPQEYNNYADIFSEWMFNILPPQCDFNHAINLKESFVLKVVTIYPLNPQEVKACKDFVKENLKTGRICPSKSPQASPFFFIKKKDGKLHPIQDYQYLNSHTIKNTYPLSLVSDLINNLQQFSRFTKFNI